MLEVMAEIEDLMDVAESVSERDEITVRHSLKELFE